MYVSVALIGDGNLDLKTLYMVFKLCDVTDLDGIEYYFYTMLVDAGYVHSLFIFL